MSGYSGIDVTVDAAEKWADDVEELNNETDDLLIQISGLIKEFTKAAEGSYIDDINKGWQNLYDFGKDLHKQLSHLSEGVRTMAEATKKSAGEMVDVAGRLGRNL